MNRYAVGCGEVLARCLLLASMFGLLFLLGRGVVSLYWSLIAEPQLSVTFLKNELVRSLTLLAVFEVYKTVQTYFAHGRVKVTAVFETILVALLTELLALCFRGVPTIELFGISGAVVALLVARILAIRYSPDGPPLQPSGWMMVEERSSFM